MILLFLLALSGHPVAPSAGINFVCQTEAGGSFSVFAPGASATAGPVGDIRQLYRVSGLGEADHPDLVMDAMPDTLTVIWRREDGAETLLDIDRYDADAATARYKLRRESGAGAPIVTITATDGACLARSVSGETEAQGGTR